MLEAIVTWLPLVLILGAFILFARASAKTYQQHVDRIDAINFQLLEVNREMIAELREIKEILKDRP